MPTPASPSLTAAKKTKEAGRLATALLLALAAPAFAGIHYKSVTRTESASGRGGGETQAEGWAAGDKARVDYYAVLRYAVAVPTGEKWFS